MSFYNGGGVFHLFDCWKEFFLDVKDDATSVFAICHDLPVVSYSFGCRPLGLINKFVTGPLWRVMKQQHHILDMNMENIW